MRNHLHFIDRRHVFIKRAGFGLIPLGHEQHLLRQFQHLNLGQGVAHKHVEEKITGTVSHPHKHSTKQTMKKRNIQGLKFNYYIIIDYK